MFQDFQAVAAVQVACTQAAAAEAREAELPNDAHR